MPSGNVGLDQELLRLLRYLSHAEDVPLRTDECLLDLSGLLMKAVEYVPWVIVTVQVPEA